MSTSYSTFGKKELSRGISPPVSNQKFVETTHEPEEDKHKSKPIFAPQETTPTILTHFPATIGLKDGTNTVKSPTTNSTVKQKVSIKPQVGSTTNSTTLRRPKHDQNQFKAKKSSAKKSIKWTTMHIYVVYRFYHILLLTKYSMLRANWGSQRSPFSNNLYLS